jgi:hypothetical protein
MKILFSGILFLTLLGIGMGFHGDPDMAAEVKELLLFKSGTHYEVRLKSEGKMLIYLEPDAWQGNSDVYSVAGGRRVGHHWSQFLMASPGKWLTDRVESEGEFLIDFKVLKDEGKIVIYAGRWGFRDYFVTAAVHYIWVENDLLYRYVKTNLTVLRDIPDPVGEIWVELMNDPDYYMLAVAKTMDGIKTYDMRGITGGALREYTLDRYGWIALINPSSSGVKGSPVLVLVDSTHKVHPAVDSIPQVDTIGLHLLGEDVRILKRGDYYELNYLLIVSTKPNDYSWIDDAVKEAEPMIDLIERGEATREVPQIVTETVTTVITSIEANKGPTSSITTIVPYIPEVFKVYILPAVYVGAMGCALYVILRRRPRRFSETISAHVRPGEGKEGEGEETMPGVIVAAASMLRCRRCGFDNPAGSRFCNQCGAQIEFDTEVYGEEKN